MIVHGLYTLNRCICHDLMTQWAGSFGTIRLYAVRLTE